MKRRMVRILVGALTMVASLTAVASATLWFGHQPRLPKSLR